MSKNLRNTVIGALAGTAAAGVLALVPHLPSAIASEEPVATLLKSQNDFFPPPFDTDGLWKPDTITDDTVSRDVLNRSVVRKIEFGYTSYVTIVRTPTGVYSTDGLQSPHVRYPGIHETLPEDDDYAVGQVALWDGNDWVSLDEIDAGSFIALPVAVKETAAVPEEMPAATAPALPISPVFEDEKDTEATTYVHPLAIIPGDGEPEEPEPPVEPEEPAGEAEVPDGVLDFDPSLLESDGPNAPDDIGPDHEGPSDEEVAEETEISPAAVRI